jgi:hypothetical protein
MLKAFSFIITKPGQDLNGAAMMSNTNWWIRTQSTSTDANDNSKGQGSAKTGGNAGTLPACKF